MEKAQPASLHALLRFIASLTLRNIFLAINKEGWLNGPSVNQSFPVKEPSICLLRYAADALKKLGTYLTVGYNWKPPNEFTAVLMNPDFTATELHYCDYVLPRNTPQGIKSQPGASVEGEMSAEVEDDMEDWE
jgi:hypothetical protein